MAREIEDAGASKIIALDVHNESIGGYFRIAVFENLRASKNFIDYIKENIGKENLVIVAPDAGAALRAQNYANNLKTEMVIIYKKRDYSQPNSLQKMSLVGEVKGKKAILVDDILDTGGTAIKAMETLKKEGTKEIYFVASHVLLNGSAEEKLNKAYEQGIFTKIIGTDATLVSEDFKRRNKWYEEVSLAKYFAKVIYNINKGKSISQLLE